LKKPSKIDSVGDHSNQGSLLEEPIKRVVFYGEKRTGGKKRWEKKGEKRETCDLKQYSADRFGRGLTGPGQTKIES